MDAFQVSRRDVLTLAESGDLLLVREHVTHTAMQMTLDPTVARDIALMQQGSFPTERTTSLPGIVAGSLPVRHVIICALLLRHMGTLHVIEVSTQGIVCTPFTERFAVRRLQHVRSEQLNSTLRELSEEIFSLAPIHWADHADDSLTSTLHQKLPITHGLLKRSLEIFQGSIAEARRRLTLTKNTDAAESCEDSQVEKVVASPPWRAHHMKDGHVAAPLPSWAFLTPQEDLQIDVQAHLSAAFSAAIYEHLGLLLRHHSDAASTLTIPSKFWSNAPPDERCQFQPPEALGIEMFIQAKSTTN
ncbi:TPA: hypothetical protein N0F65_002183 [Lagenidium giganteum]|uniref:Uncharacterized protein n=1 Tax=Lagenidium giganteum TaxID=4803 RepID=A0AAV2YKJ7_9STRA|nr:TPA: hypothetical protein N0F65_002183 [Lagenidium giganteum]